MPHSHPENDEELQSNSKDWCPRPVERLFWAILRGWFREPATRLNLEEWNLEVNINLRDFMEKIERDEQHLGLFLHGVREPETF
jgi:hypothetical protein